MRSGVALPHGALGLSRTLFSLQDSPEPKLTTTGPERRCEPTNSLVSEIVAIIREPPLIIFLDGGLFRAPG